MLRSGPRYRVEFYVERMTSTRGKRFLFERDGKFGWGTKAIATRFHGKVDAERAAALNRGYDRSGGHRVRLVHA